MYLFIYALYVYVYLCVNEQQDLKKALNFGFAPGPNISIVTALYKHPPPNSTTIRKQQISLRYWWIANQRDWSHVTYSNTNTHMGKILPGCLIHTIIAGNTKTCTAAYGGVNFILHFLQVWVRPIKKKNRYKWLMYLCYA